MTLNNNNNNNNTLIYIAPACRMTSEALLMLIDGISDILVMKIILFLVLVSFQANNFYIIHF